MEKYTDTLGRLTLQLKATQSFKLSYLTEFSSFALTLPAAH